MEGSKLFENYRALGYYANHVPLQVVYHERYKENYIITNVGKSYLIYKASNMGLTRVSNPQEQDIGTLVALGNRVYVSVGNKIKGIERNKHDVVELIGHEHEVHIMLPMAPLLISIDRQNTVCVWSLDTNTIYLELSFPKGSFCITAAMHPVTYVNKLLLGSKQGSLQLWNIKSNKMVYEFQGWGRSVTIMKQAPAIDVVGIGLANGDIILHNIKFDETILKFKQDWGNVIGLAFRTDGVPCMISASTQGHLAVWNLEDKRLSSQIRNAHDAAVTGLECLADEPLFVTSSSDNSIKIWIFDQSDGSARLLRSRVGHSAPVSQIRFNEDTTLVSAGQDCRMFVFSTDHDSYNTSLGTAFWNKKAEVRKLMPSFSQISCESKRSSDWEDLVAVHTGSSAISIWSTRSTMSEHLSPRRPTVIVCCCVSPCGHFVFLGYKDGVVEKLNMQSKLSRGVSTAKHDRAVRAIGVDGLSQMFVSGGADSKIIIWSVKSLEPLEKLKMRSSVSSICVHKESGMVGVAMDNFAICVVDLETKRVVRRFPGHSGRITDLTFNPSGKWMITSSMDCTVCVWDLLTGALIDRTCVDQAVTSLDMSPRGEFLALSKLDEPGVFLWSNRSMYMHVPLKALTIDGEEMEDLSGDFKSSDQIAKELVTLSLLPESRWANLLNLDVIRNRNQLSQPTKAPKAAPFFLPTIPGLVTQFAIEQDLAESREGDNVTSFSFSSGLNGTLMKCLSSQNPEPYMELMKKFGVATIESEIRCLEPEPGAYPQMLQAFLQVTAMALRSRKSYELIQSYLALCLKVHHDVIMNSRDLLDCLEEVNEECEKSWRHLDQLFDQTRCLIAYQRSAVL